MLWIELVIVTTLVMENGNLLRGHGAIGCCKRTCMLRYVKDSCEDL